MGGNKVSHETNGEVYSPQIFVFLCSSRMITRGDVLIPTPIDVVDLDSFTFDWKTK